MSITSAPPATLPPRSSGLWILPVLWKTRAIRSASTDDVPEGAFPTTPWTPQTAPTGSTGTFVVLSIKTSR